MWYYLAMTETTSSAKTISTTTFAVRVFIGYRKGNVSRKSSEGIITDTCDTLAEALKCAEKRVIVASRAVVEEQIRRETPTRTTWCNTPLVTYRNRRYGWESETHETELVKELVLAVTPQIKLSKEW